jgi:mannosyltransferase OCH1-like enzyme
MIPLVLHQTWETMDPPAPLADFRATFAACNPGLDMRLYDAAARRELVRRHRPDFSDTFEAIALPVVAADVFRLLIVHELGGFYADLDVVCHRPIDVFAATDKAVFPVEAHMTRRRQIELGYAQPLQIGNFMFAAPPRHPFIGAFLNSVIDRLKARPIATRAEVEDASGPRALTRFFYAQRPADAGVLHQIFWGPPDIYAELPVLRTRIHCRHRNLGSWKGDAARPPLSRRLIERNKLPNPFPSGLWHDFGW